MSRMNDSSEGKVSRGLGVGMLTRLRAHVCGLIPFDDKNCITFTFCPQKMVEGDGA